MILIFKEDIQEQQAKMIIKQMLNDTALTFDEDSIQLHRIQDLSENNPLTYMDIALYSQSTSPQG